MWRFLVLLCAAEAFNPLRQLQTKSTWNLPTSAPPKDIVESYLKTHNATLSETQNARVMWAQAQQAHSDDMAHFFHQYPKVSVDESRDVVRAEFNERIAAYTEKMNAVPQRILDVECGCGCSTESLASSFKSEEMIVGIDLNAYNVAMAATEHPGITFVHGNASAMPFEDATFDMVSLDHVIGSKTLVEIKQILLESGRVLRHGGVLAVLDTSDCASLPEYTYAVDNVKYILEHAGFACVERAVDETPGTAMIFAWRTVGTPIPVNLKVPDRYYARAKKSNWLGMTPVELVAFVIQFALAYAWSFLIMDLLRAIFTR